MLSFLLDPAKQKNLLTFWRLKTIHHYESLYQFPSHFYVGYLKLGALPLRVMGKVIESSLQDDSKALRLQEGSFIIVRSPRPLRMDVFVERCLEAGLDFPLNSSETC